MNHYGKLLCCCNILLNAGTIKPQTQDKDLSGQCPMSMSIQLIEVTCDPEPIQPEVQTNLGVGMRPKIPQRTPSSEYKVDINPPFAEQQE